MKKVLIFSSTYNIGSNLGGIGLRLWELAQVLADYHQITLITKGPSDFSHPGIEFKVFNEDSWCQKIDHSDVIICSDLPDTRILLYAHDKGKQIITENSVPIEHLYYSNVQNSSNPDKYYQDILTRFKLQILLTDHFIVRSRVEYQTLLAVIAMVDRLNYTTYDKETGMLKNLISFIPIGFNKYSDQHANTIELYKDKIDFLYNGGIWDYFDVLKIAQALMNLKNRSVDTSCTFMYLPPDQEIREYKRLRNFIQKNNLNDQIKFIKNKIPHYERDQYVKAAKAIICIGKEGIENLTCHRLRLRDVFLYNKPIIVDGFGATADLVKMLDIGLVVDNLVEVEDAMQTILFDNEKYSQLVNNIKKVRHQFLFENNIQSLLDFIEGSQKAADIKVKTEHSQLVKKLLNEYLELQSEPVYPI